MRVSQTSMQAKAQKKHDSLSLRIFIGVFPIGLISSQKGKLEDIKEGKNGIKEYESCCGGSVRLSRLRRLSHYGLFSLQT